MNKILFTARMARGVTEDELASELGLTLLQYRTLESGREPVIPALARALAGYFSIPAWYFLQPARQLDIMARIDLLRRQHEIYSRPENRVVPTGAAVALTTTTLELMIVKEELGCALARELELAEDLAAVIRLYESLNNAGGAGAGVTS